jgi:hypothetical protein
MLDEVIIELIKIIMVKFTQSYFWVN